MIKFKIKKNDVLLNQKEIDILLREILKAEHQPHFEDYIKKLFSFIREANNIKNLETENKRILKELKKEKKIKKKK